MKLAYFFNHFILIFNLVLQEIKIIRSDKGLEFEMKEFYQNKGIIHETSCTDTPQQNGVENRVIY